MADDADGGCCCGPLPAAKAKACVAEPAAAAVVAVAVAVAVAEDGEAGLVEKGRSQGWSSACAGVMRFLGSRTSILETRSLASDEMRVHSGSWNSYSASLLAAISCLSAGWGVERKGPRGGARGSQSVRQTGRQAQTEAARQRQHGRGRREKARQGRAGQGRAGSAHPPTRDAVKGLVAAEERVGHHAHREGVHVVAVALVHARAQDLRRHVPGGAAAAVDWRGVVYSIELAKGYGRSAVSAYVGTPHRTTQQPARI